MADVNTGFDDEFIEDIIRRSQQRTTTRPAPRQRPSVSRPPSYRPVPTGRPTKKRGKQIAVAAAALLLTFGVGMETGRRLTGRSNPAIVHAQVPEDHNPENYDPIIYETNTDNSPDFGDNYDYEPTQDYQEGIEDNIELVAEVDGIITQLSSTHNTVMSDQEREQFKNVILYHMETATPDQLANKYVFIQTLFVIHFNISFENGQNVEQDTGNNHNHNYDQSDSNATTSQRYNFDWDGTMFQIPPSRDIWDALSAICTINSLSPIVSMDDFKTNLDEIISRFNQHGVQNALDFARAWRDNVLREHEARQNGQEPAASRQLTLQDLEYYFHRLGYSDYFWNMSYERATAFRSITPEQQATINNNILMRVNEQNPSDRFIFIRDNYFMELDRLVEQNRDNGQEGLQQNHFPHSIHLGSFTPSGDPNNMFPTLHLRSSEVSDWFNRNFEQKYHHALHYSYKEGDHTPWITLQDRLNNMSDEDAINYLTQRSYSQAQTDNWSGRSWTKDDFR